ncbi:uncharacterized protein LOC143266299 [Megachile rotundata]|uniref:uncharacterized protein LOC143266299 n=1 Tax=Megachile rotundata TaxID=143995 RepID=UPI003FD1167F
MPGKRKRGCRAGRRVKARKLKLLEEKFLQVFGPEIVTLDSESDTGTSSREVPLFSYDILDTRSAIKVYNHREVPDKVLVDFFRAFRENEWSCPPSVDEFCRQHAIATGWDAEDDADGTPFEADGNNE